MSPTSQDAALALAALAASLEAIDAPAFVLGPDGSVRHANASGFRWLAQDETARRRVLREAGAGRHETFSVTQLCVPGLAPHAFAVLAAPGEPDAEARMATAASRWALTPRQVDVLRHLARGEPNKTIAMELGCAPNTVELHVSALLAKAQVESRAQLVARVWALSPTSRQTRDLRDGAPEGHGTARRER